MGEDFHDRLAQELAERPEPPVGDLVTGALSRGRRLRAVRRAKIVVGALGLTALLVGGVVLGGQLLGGGGAMHRQLPAASGTAHPPYLTIAPHSAAEPYDRTAPWHGAPAPVIEQPAGPKSPVTPAAIAYRLAQLLPAGQVSHVERGQDTSGEISLNFDPGHGTGRLHMWLASAGPIEAGCASTPDSPTTCLIGPGGAHVWVIHEVGNCVEDTVVLAEHGNGVVVQLDISTCLAWNGTTNPPAARALTTAQAIAIACDPTWGIRMSTALVTSGAQRYPHL